MSKRNISSALFILVSLISFSSLADSPITSTYFASAYYDVPMVKMAEKEGVLNDDIIEFLLSETTPADQKVAVINALGWNIEGKHNAKFFQRELQKKYNLTEKTFDLGVLSGDELLCLGYLNIMDDYFHPLDAIDILERAKRRSPDSYTYNIIWGLAEAQRAMDYDFCKVWKIMHDIDSNHSLDRDMRDAGVRIIFEYINIYKDECK